MFLLDTNVVSELRRPGRAHPRVVAWARSVPPLDISISAVTVLEIEIGVLQIERRDAAQGAILRTWLETQVLRGFDGRILPIDVAVARRCAGLHVPDPKAERDALIAATAFVHHLTLVTRNVADFKAMGISLLDPWTLGG